MSMTPAESEAILKAADWQEGDGTRRMEPELRLRIKAALEARNLHRAAALAPRPRDRASAAARAALPDLDKKTPLQPSPPEKANKAKKVNDG